MDQIKPDLKQLQKETSDESKKPLSISTRYRQTVSNVILKARLCCSLPALSVEEAQAQVEAWCETLYCTIPTDGLNDAYLHAMRHRGSSYPLTAGEMLQAWRILSAEAQRNRDFNKPCALCFGTGFGNVYDPKTDTEVQKECPHCNRKISTDLERVN